MELLERRGVKAVPGGGDEERVVCLAARCHGAHDREDSVGDGDPPRAPGLRRLDLGARRLGARVGIGTLMKSRTRMARSSGAAHHGGRPSAHQDYRGPHLLRRKKAAGRSAAVGVPTVADGEESPLGLMSMRYRMR